MCFAAAASQGFGGSLKQHILATSHQSFLTLRPPDQSAVYSRLSKAVFFPFCFFLWGGGVNTKVCVVNVIPNSWTLNLRLRCFRQMKSVEWVSRALHLHGKPFVILDFGVHVQWFETFKNSVAHLNNNDHKTSPTVPRAYIKHRLADVVNKKTIMAGHLIYGKKYFFVMSPCF